MDNNPFMFETTTVIVVHHDFHGFSDGFLWISFLRWKNNPVMFETTSEKILKSCLMDSHLIDSPHSRRRKQQEYIYNI